MEVKEISGSISIGVAGAEYRELALTGWGCC